MDLRNLPTGLSPAERCAFRRTLVTHETKLPLESLACTDEQVAQADEKNCEQMIGMLPLPVGIAGPLTIVTTDNVHFNVHIPLATTEGALVASVNRGCKVVSACGGARTTCIRHGISRSIALLPPTNTDVNTYRETVLALESEWRKIGEATSAHLRILKTETDVSADALFLTLYADTDEAMGMNMITIACQAVGEWLASNAGGTFVTVAANVDSDKKPSRRTHDRGRGYEVTAEVTLSADICRSLLKCEPTGLLAVAHAKLEQGSAIAGSIGKNLHVANVIAAVYLATGQDAAHVVEGSLADTTMTLDDKQNVHLSVRLPAVLVGVRGGGTNLPAQRQCLDLLLAANTSGLHPCLHLAQCVGAAVLAGELSLLAAQAGHQLASAHKTLGR